jgi:hypothetical protein
VELGSGVVKRKRGKEDERTRGREDERKGGRKMLHTQITKVVDGLTGTHDAVPLVPAHCELD